MKVLDKGHIELEEFMGGDLKVVNMARGSFGKKQEKLKDGDDKLISFLMKNRHGTPFEHSIFTFHIKAPLFVVREWQRHRIGSYSEISGRYVKLKQEYYVPELKNIRSQKGKPGSYTFETLKNDEVRTEARSLINFSQDWAFKRYQKLLDLGVAKEVCRVILPVGLYTQFYWTVNARSLMNFLNLRNSENAMLEIREYAQVLEWIFEEEMPLTYDAFIDNGRVAP